MKNFSATCEQHFNLKTADEMNHEIHEAHEKRTGTEHYIRAVYQRRTLTDGFSLKSAGPVTRCSLDREAGCAYFT
jgi:hypothetical protein